MLSLRPTCRFCVATTTAAATTISTQKSKPKTLDEPALVKLKAERNPEKLFHLFKANAPNRLVIENRFAFEDTVARLAGAKRFDYIENILEHQKTLPQGRREGFIVRIIMLYGKVGMTGHALQTFYTMHHLGCTRTVKSFNAAFKVLAQTFDLEAIQVFLDEVPQQFYITPDAFSLNIIIKAFCDMGILDSAYLIMVEMEKMGIQADVVTYTTLISAFYKNNRSEVANGLWNLMVRKGCLPNLATFNARIQYLVNQRRAWKANSLMGKMQLFGINPDEVTVNLVIKGFYQAGYPEMARRVYSALCEKGYKPNRMIFQTLIHYECIAGDFSLAFRISKDSMERNWFPSVHTLCKLLEGLWKKAEYRKARVIMILIQRRKPPYSTDELEVFQSILSKG
ncbi:pentatricopeptide repeat-containing protein At1g80150, mitochondrial-like [Macadamia integrifolia]|uniref:pentatricopeptide repeat-containing protein At1g80150, mitochondrial-like n=1 Tax=Macadamia integrifolia TaxID=60698 RepID=UPI001C4FD18B|nr:pentatricopeptide repeat-containing protein At1g80150, mitochondrial-like [Macadamia integrifolia]XP_042508090.1 pentatricopeptide repeat-containing protein At1g80150, mitochondrial-like [Macadamia integrifolia]XP_042508091.1 pentatricopeptide repeat-containing protein At1g80150, mitochondrial-like [Macadamia integrifolia]XP_042508092.1 pentatricopeptide repeat-containing protein At1g80150, mitochondrial-like [Macadamia integrifolia]XP_042508093.1 pentatricopeptide repeat-containing protein 